MTRWTTPIACIILALGLPLGCGSEPDRSIDHDAEAREQITPGNVDEQLRRLEQEIAADEAAPGPTD